MIIKRQRPSLIVAFCILSVLIGFSVIQPNICAAVVVWSDNSDDGNFDDWTVTQGDFSAADNSLRGTGAGWNFASHLSSVAYGTWIFDVDVTETDDDHFYVYILSHFGSNYRFSIFTDAFPGWTDGDEFTLLKQEGATTEAIAEYVPVGDISGWYSFEVHRNTTGHFSVYINGVLRIQVLDNDITESSSFMFGTQIGPGIDNIEIHDLTDNTTTPPPGIPGFPWPAILVAVFLAIGLGIWRRKETP